MGSITGHRVDYGGVRGSERPAAHFQKKIDPDTSLGPGPREASTASCRLDCLPSVSVIPISDGSGFLPSVVFSMAIQTGASS